MTKKSEFSKYLAALGCKGGQATAKNRTPEQRKEAARKAAQARWAKEKKARKES
jgi:general stress protein YciG